MLAKILIVLFCLALGLISLIKSIDEAIDTGQIRYAILGGLSMAAFTAIAIYVGQQGSD